MAEFGHPVIDAAWATLCEIHRETGGGDGLSPNKDPAYLGALRVFHAALDAHRDIIQARTQVRHGFIALALVEHDNG